MCRRRGVWLTGRREQEGGLLEAHHVRSPVRQERAAPGRSGLCQCGSLTMWSNDTELTTQNLLRSYLYGA